MAKLRCTKAAKVTDDSGARFLAVGAFWQAGDTYDLRLVEAVEAFKLFPKAFEPIDDEAKVAAERAAK